MAKVKLGEMRDLIKNINNVENFEYKGLNIELKTYLPIEEKMEIAAKICALCLDVEDENIILNRNSKEIVQRYYIIKHYTNITLPKDIYELYDILEQLGLYSVVANKLYDEIIKIDEIIKNMIEYELEKQKHKNNIVCVIKDILYELINEIPSEEDAKHFISQVEKKFNEFDPNKLKFIKDFIKQNSGAENENKK